MNSKQLRKARLRTTEDKKRNRRNGIAEPVHYRLLKACAQKIQLRSAAKKGKAYRPLTRTELDDIASGAIVHFVELQRSSTIAPPHNSCACDDCLAKLEQRAITSAYSAAKWARSEYFRSQICDGKRVNATDTDDFDAIYQDHPQPMHDLDTMLGQLANDRQRRLAELLANQSTLEQISEDVGYKSWSAVTYAKRQIAKRLADYKPAYADCHIMRAVREACELFIRAPFPKVEPDPQERDNDNRDDAPRPRRAKDTRQVDTAIPASPGEYRPMQFDPPAQHLPRLPIMPHCCRLSNGFVICG